MAKPILILRVCKEADKKLIRRLIKNCEDEIKNEYHVFAVPCLEEETILFECLNDCKGLSDVNIEILINNFIKEIYEKKE